MNEAQMDMFRLQNVPDPIVNIPGQMAQAGDPMVQSVEVDCVSEGLGRSVAWMAQNGPTRPTHRGKALMMTQQQLEEQRMNEAKGLPSNLEEASRVVALEQTVTNLNENMGKMTSLLTQLVQATASVAPLPTVTQGDQTYYPHPHPTERHVELLPTPPVRPVVELPPSQPKYPLVQPEDLIPQPFPLPGPRTVTPIPLSVAPLSPPVISPPVSPPPVSLGTAGSSTTEEGFDRFEVEEAVSPGEEPVSTEDLIENQPPECDPNHPALVAEQKLLERQQMLTDQNMTWLKSKDPHKFWRQFLSNACNKNLSYNTWPPEFQNPFNERFQAMVTDPVFVSTLCGRVIRFQNGHLVAAHVMGAFVVASAGYLSFALLEA